MSTFYASMILIELNLATGTNVLPKSTLSTCEHPFATNLALKWTITCLAFFFVRKIHLHFMALRQWSVLLCVLRYKRIIFLLHRQLSLVCITQFNWLSQFSRFPNNCHICMLFISGWQNVVLPPSPKRFVRPICILRIARGFIAILRCWMWFGCDFFTMVKFWCFPTMSGFCG